MDDVAEGRRAERVPRKACDGVSIKERSLMGEALRTGESNDLDIIFAMCGLWEWREGLEIF